jgi:hypothetical protein
LGNLKDRNLGISRFVGAILESQGIVLFEKWFDHLQKLTPNQKISDFKVRDKVLEEILSLVTQGNHIILNKKDKIFIEELLNRFLMRFDLLRPNKTL